MTCSRCTEDEERLHSMFGLSVSFGRNFQRMVAFKPMNLATVCWNNPSILGRPYLFGAFRSARLDSLEPRLLPASQINRNP